VTGPATTITSGAAVGTPFGATAACTGSQVLLGGGFTISTANPAQGHFVSVVASSPISAGLGGVWEVKGVVNTAGLSGNGSLTAYAICTP